MKSINILCFLLLSTTLSLVPFVAFSRSFTSDNPIVLPTTTHNLIDPAVLDVDGVPLKIGEDYIINNPLIGGGAVYWKNIGNHKCPNVVSQHTSSIDNIGDGMPVKFVLKANDDVIREMVAINIKFSNDTSKPCGNETVWKVDDKEFVVTGGTLGNENTFFKIMKYETEGTVRSKYEYKLLYCPPQLMCKDVTVASHENYPRLVAGNNGFQQFVFMKT
ncbi:cysteine protease inhibitor 1-like [Solanum dulcamara]|uniref:cysteine protease inhibitor 1-like n=1 Tax=Solanum dulcamara TaxID=45834 RepID=UPI002486625A|nr:cysteine protease inhibitor 1-like [Solanum dulcamara]